MTKVELPLRSRKGRALIVSFLLFYGLYDDSTLLLRANVPKVYDNDVEGLARTLSLFIFSWRHKDFRSRLSYLWV